MKQLSSFFKKALVCMAAMSLTGMAQAGGDGKTWVDYVNPYIGNISHLLVPTFPTVQLPNSMPTCRCIVATSARFVTT